MEDMHERDRSYYSVADEQMFDTNPFGRCYILPRDWTCKGFLPIRGYCYSTSAIGVSRLEDAKRIAMSAKEVTGREHVVVELTVIKRVRKIS